MCRGRREFVARKPAMILSKKLRRAIRTQWGRAMLADVMVAPLRIPWPERQL